MVDNVPAQLQAAAVRAGLDRLFGPLTFDERDAADPHDCAEGEAVEVRFANADGPVGVLVVDVYDSGDPGDAGLTVGLRGWRLDDDVASV